MASPNDILLNALKDANILGIDETAIPAEYTALALSKFNRRVSQWNAKGTLGSYEYTQVFTLPAAVSNSPNGYTIGATADSPKLVVTSGRAPTEIDSAKRVEVSGSTDVETSISVLTFQQYNALTIPGVLTDSTVAVYLQTIPRLPVLWCYGFSSGERLRLSWRALLNTVLLASIATDIDWNEGVEHALTATLTVDLGLSLHRQVSADQKLEARDARMSMMTRQGMPIVMEPDYSDDSGGDGYSIADFVSRSL